MFSALGLFPDVSYKPLSERIPSALLKASQWLSVPGAYFDDRSMLQTLIPIFATSIVTTSIGSLYVSETAASLEIINDLATKTDSIGSALLPIQITTSALMTYLSTIMHTQAGWLSDIGSYLNTLDQGNILNNIANLVSVLLIIRMSRLIGTDRDSIIAEKIQATASEFPVRPEDASTDAHRLMFLNSKDAPSCLGIRIIFTKSHD